MEVIYIGGSKKLIKGHKYKIDRLYNDGTTSVRWLEGKLEIDGIGTFLAKTFRTIDGKCLPKINYGEVKNIKERTEFKDLKKGDYLICKTNNLKTLVLDKTYVIEDLLTIENKVPSYNYHSNSNISPSYRTIKDEYVILKGINKKIKYNPWKFEKISTQKQREMHLLSVLDNQEPDLMTEIPSRKIDISENLKKDLIELLSESILDKNRHHYTVVEWAVKQLGKKIDVNIGDYDELLEMKLSDILKIIDN